ncbi:pyridoxamine 5-phosphate oxidase [Hyphomicrobium methylovorum]|uniref:pyridoxamine 5'-phosphate oxidase family protein n=1 Tax=Hyphomicrobium methylovorum TaxID=84 RepID=UPI0015E747E0|nr:pyridoxamine 5'-phosphate oxidase family protein [Hyphomicrobium methylovorum]MBA2127385.1 pyridoxamine 5-phosphate oxidase [Hyphomicrobium methylovorum]
MRHRFADLMFTPRVQKIQAEQGSRASYARMIGQPQAGSDPLTVHEAEFIAARDSFYMATVSETGWPYVQHRGGLPGFLKVIDAHTIGFADYRGNRQYVSAGNLSGDDRVALFLMDYPNRQRLKLIGHASIIDPETEPEIAAKLQDGYAARVERGIIIHVEGYDWNCPQHITPRFSVPQIEDMLQPLKERLAALEQENAALRLKVADGARVESNLD